MMRQLNRVQTVIFLFGGMLMVAGAGCYVMMWQQRVVCWIFLVGSVMFSLMQTMQVYTGTELVLRRLKNIQGLASLLFVISGVLMADSAYGFFRPMFDNITDYIEIVYNKWVVLLLVAALLEVYTTHRINNELSKKNLKE